MGMELKVWLLTSVIIILITVLWWIVRLGIKGIYSRLDQMISQNEETSKQMVQQCAEIEHLESRINVNDKRLDDHAGRIRNLEIKK
jgi:hypothetical protein